MSRQPASGSLLTSSSGVSGASGDTHELRGGTRRRTAQETAEILYPSMIDEVSGINGA